MRSPEQNRQRTTADSSRGGSQAAILRPVSGVSIAHWQVSSRPYDPRRPPCHALGSRCDARENQAQATMSWYVIVTVKP